jgi:hypothetical protein
MNYNLLEKVLPVGFIIDVHPAYLVDEGRMLPDLFFKFFFGVFVCHSCEAFCNSRASGIDVTSSVKYFLLTFKLVVVQKTKKIMIVGEN